MWNATRCARKHTVLRGHEDGVWNAAYNPDGSRIVTASGDRTARLWDAMTGAELAILRGHDDDVHYAAFSPDGRLIVTTSSDGAARLWDATMRGEPATLRGHDDHVSHATLSPYRHYIATTSSVSTARLWRNFPTTQELIDYAWCIVPRRLTTKEREWFFLDRAPSSGAQPRAGLDCDQVIR